MPGAPEQRLNPEERSNLVAFVDGELTEQESRVISTKLTQSATARKEVEALKKTWELLEHLPRQRATERFSERTIESIRVLGSKSSPWPAASRAWVSRSVRFVICLLTAGVFLASGYALTRWAWPDPTARLARDLSLAEHLDEYLEAGSFEFLEELAKSKDFSGDP